MRDISAVLADIVRELHVAPKLKFWYVVNSRTTVKFGYNEQLGRAIYIRYNRVNLCSNMTILLLISARYT
jgi:hypothetical protein